MSDGYFSQIFLQIDQSHGRMNSLIAYFSIWMSFPDKIDRIIQSIMFIESQVKGH